MINIRLNRIAVLIAILFFPLLVLAQNEQEDSIFVVNNYSKIERMIPMRDGVKLFTAIYQPKASSEKR